MNFATDERPTDFSQFVGNESIVKAIKTGLENTTLPNAILLTGNSGCGKSTICNLIINSLNVNKDINLHFIDCGVTKDMESFRKIVDSIKAPSFGGTGENVVFVLEECHKLSASKNAQESLLAILENLPSNKYVIATTTNKEMLLNTFVSRFVEYHLKPLTEEQLYNGILVPVVKKYGIKIKKGTLQHIIEASNGNNRKALSILSSIASLPPEEQDANITGTENAGQEEIKNVVNRILSDNYDSFSLKEHINALKKTNAEPETVRCFILAYIANLMPLIETEGLASKATILFEYLNTHTCYTYGWGVLYCAIYELYKNFRIF